MYLIIINNQGKFGFNRILENPSESKRVKFDRSNDSSENPRQNEQYLLMFNSKKSIGDFGVKRFTPKITLHILLDQITLKVEKKVALDCSCCPE